MYVYIYNLEKFKIPFMEIHFHLKTIIVNSKKYKKGTAKNK
jgi:hypothetical protein